MDLVKEFTSILKNLNCNGWSEISKQKLYQLNL